MLKIAGATGEYYQPTPEIKTINSHEKENTV